MIEHSFQDLRKALLFPLEVFDFYVKKEEVGEFINHCQNFKYLQSLSLVDLHLKDVPDEIFKLGNLKTLNLRGNGLRKLKNEISELSKLETLILNNNALMDLPLSLATLPELRRLNLDHNHLKKLPDCILSMTELTHLSIDDNEFSEDERERIMSILPIWF